jgi:antitoxin component HigA of HigAB toxin-antitoxin module
MHYLTNNCLSGLEVESENLIEPLMESFMKIQNDTELQAALREIAPFFAGAEPDPGTPEAKWFLDLASAIEEYESKIWLSVPGPKLPEW